MTRRTAVTGVPLLLLATVLAIPIPSPSATQTGSPYRFRGVIFGPYGRPWTHEDRMSILGWMGRPWRDTGRPRMNIYVHAAKDDVYQRVRWRAAYPPDRMKEFAEEISLARSLGVEWVPNLSPGVPLIPSTAVPNGPPSRDVCFSCPDDVEVLVSKLRPFAGLGVRTFMISFDDVQKISTHPEDVIAYGRGDAAYGRMTADLLNGVDAALRAAYGAVTILTVPADYSGTKRTDYLTAFGQTLKPDVRVMWTGTHVVSPEILASEAAGYSAAISTPASGPRRLLVWDNFPVNDYNGNILSGTGLPTNFKLNVGPYKGRRADLVPVIDGILANPMNEAEASKIPLYAVAAYLNDPAAYTGDAASCGLDDDVAGCLSEAAWLEGIAEFGGPLAPEVFSFVDQMRSTPMDRTESPVFRARWEALRAAFAGPFWPASWSSLRGELLAEGAAPATLRSGLQDARFLVETRNHLAQLERNAGVGTRAADLLAGTRPGLRAEAVAAGGGSETIRGTVRRSDPAAVAGILARLAPLEAAVRASPYSVHGDRFQESIDKVYVRENQMDAFTDFVHRALAAWLPRAPIAATGPVTVTVNGVPAAVSSAGEFELTVPVAPEIVVVATDAAGFQTGLRL